MLRYLRSCHATYSRHTSRNETTARSEEAGRHPSSKTHRTYPKCLPSSLGGKCTGMGEAKVHLADRGRTHLAETLKDLAETLEHLAETTGIWPMADPYHGNSANGRPRLQLTLKPRSVKLTHHQELGNITLSGIHLDKRAQQGSPTRII